VVQVDDLKMDTAFHGKVVHCYVFGAYLKYQRYIIPGVEGVVRAEDALEWT